MRPKRLHSLIQFPTLPELNALFPNGFFCRLKTMQEKGRGGGWRVKTSNTPPHVQFPQHRKLGRQATGVAVKQDDPA